MSDPTSTDPVADYWQDYLREIGPDPRAAVRVRRALEHRLGAPGAIAAEVQPAPRAAAAILFLKSSAISVGLALVGLGGLHVGARTLAPEPAELPARDEPIAPAPPGDVAPRTTVVRTDAPPVQLEVPVVTTAAPTRTAARPSGHVAIPRPGASAAAPVAVPSATPAATDALRAETALMERVRDAVARKDDATVLVLLGEHAERFPRGVMIEERRGWTVIARCRRGESDARALADRFVVEYPRSTLGEHIHRACSSHSSTDPIRAAEQGP